MKTLLHFFLFLVTVEVIHLCVNVIPAQSQCLEDQKLSLLSLKKSLVYNSSASSKLISWNSSTDCCSWVGVTCTDGLVVGLDISSESISGGVDDSSSIFDLEHLQSLNLAYNKRLGSGYQIPSAIGKLTNLSYLNLSNTAYSGQIPFEISHLTRLVILDLSNLLENPSLQLQNPNLKLLIGDLSELVELHLDGVNITAEKSEWCQAISSSLPKLRVLSLSNCHLSGPIDISLLKLRSLSVIDLSANNLSTQVPEFLSNFTNLTSLRLMSCGLFGAIPARIFQVPTLEKIHLALNEQLQGTIPEFPKNGSLRSLVLSATNFSGSLPDSIGNLKMLSQLVLSYCHLSGPIPMSFSDLTNLEDLDLGQNQLGGNIPSSLFSLPRLKMLQLSNNQFSGHFHELFNNVSASSLEFLFLSHNNLSGSFLLNGLLQQFRNLSRLDLSFNSLSVDYNDTDSFPQFWVLGLASCKLRKFPDFLRNQSKLIILDLSQNQIRGEIPNWIWRLSNLGQLNLSYNSLVTLEGPFLNLTSTLSMLDLHSNQLQGPIPFFPPSARYLDYSSNNFSFTIPTDIGALTFFLSLSNNNLHGIIPESICNASTLEVLDLSYNSFSGVSPQCLTAMSSLGVLNLRRNKLTGTIADRFPRNCSLETLDLSENQIQGQLPKSLEKCTLLEVLNLRNNHIRDTFPLMLKNIPNLRVLVLRSNRFYGHISCPKTNGTWSKLQILDIADNNFSGEIPGQCLTTWRAMMDEEEDDFLSKLEHFRFEAYEGLYYQDAITVTNKGLEMELLKILTVFTSIDISCNNFNGSIPEQVGELKLLYVLNFSSNALTGAIPSSLGNLGQLESLDLSNNKLGGTIPQEFAKLNFLSFLNVSNNQLVGMIPRSTQISTFPASCFAGNKGLYGPPLTGDKIVGGPSGLLLPAFKGGHGIDRVLNPWIGAEIGFTVGFGVAIGSLVFCKRWSKWYYTTMYKILLKIFPQLEERIGPHRRHVNINQRWKR